MKVLVLMGGSSPERVVSLATGRGVADALRELGHEVTALDPATGETLALGGDRPAEIGGEPAARDAAGDERSLVMASSPELPRADVVFVALHGGIGEDGTLQALLDLAGVPYTGSGMLACALAMDKHRTKMLLRSARIPVPRGRLLEGRDKLPDPGSLGGFPIVIKPNAQGSSVGVHIVQNEERMEAALDDAFRFPPVLFEEYIPGRELTVAVLGGKALPVLEVIPEGGWYDFEHKYTKGETKYQVPAEVSSSLADEAARLAVMAYEALGCAGVARVDFRLAEDDNLYCLEVNTIPGMTGTSLVPMAAQAAGVGYPELVARLLELATP